MRIFITCAKHRRRGVPYFCDRCDVQPLLWLLPIACVVGAAIGIFGGVWFVP